MLEWLLTKDTDTKINHLYVANLRQRLHSQSIAISGTPEAARHAEVAARLKLTEAQLQEIKDEVSQTKAVLSDPPLDAINAKFEQTYNAKLGYDLQWFKVYAASTLSIRKISDEIGRSEEYTYLYSSFSRFSHGSDMWKSIAIGDQTVQMHPIREPQYIPEAIWLAAELARRVFLLIIREYRAARKSISTESFYRSGVLVSAKHITFSSFRRFTRFRLRLACGYTEALESPGFAACALTLLKCNDLFSR